MNIFAKIFLAILEVIQPAPKAIYKSIEMVRYVIDGDTVICSGDLTVRIAGIDAPEMKGNQYFAQESKKFLKKLILYKWVYITGYEYGPYGRLIGKIEFGDQNIGLKMVKKGMAIAYRGKSPKGFNITPYIIAEKKAKKSNKGMWSSKGQVLRPDVWRRMEKN